MSECDHFAVEMKIDAGIYIFTCMQCKDVIIRDLILPRAVYNLDRMAYSDFQTNSAGRCVENYQPQRRSRVRKGHN
jgi:hypothetical protein